MKKEDMQTFVSNLQNKLGKENSSIIADDLASLIADNTSMNNTILEKENLLKEKESLNQKLVMANSSLLQQVGFSNSIDNNSSFSNNEEDEEKPISWSDCFDKKGNFLK